MIQMRSLVLRRSGNAVRLIGPEGAYSYYHPNHLFTGLGWDAQTASLFLLKQAVRSILILGFGGGTVARQCQRLFSNAEITGVEINEQVIRIAEENFDLGSIGARVVAMSAQDYLKKTRRLFDAIVDDIWDPERHSVKPIHGEPRWAELIKSRLTPGGMYAVNLHGRAQNSTEVVSAIERLETCFTDLREVRPGPPGETAVITAGSVLWSPSEARAKLRRLPLEFRAGISHVRFLTIKGVGTKS